MKEFNCNQECGSNCCEFVVIHSVIAADEILDKQYFDLRGIEFIEKIVSKDLKLVYFKIPIKCKWFKNEKCINYKNRPFSCKVGHGNNKPFEIKGCIYGDDE